MSEPTKFVFMNLNLYAVQITTEAGVPLAVPRNKAVKGDFFSRFSAPNGPLSMVHEDRVATEAIIHVAEPRNEITAVEWGKRAAADDPILTTLPAPAVVEATPPVITETTSNEPVVETTEVVEEVEGEKSPEQEGGEDETKTVPPTEEAPKVEEATAPRRGPGRPPGVKNKQK